MSRFDEANTQVTSACLAAGRALDEAIVAYEALVVAEDEVTESAVRELTERGALGDPPELALGVLVDVGHAMRGAERARVVLSVLKTLRGRD